MSSELINKMTDYKKLKIDFKVLQKDLLQQKEHSFFKELLDMQDTLQNEADINYYFKAVSKEGILDKNKDYVEEIKINSKNYINELVKILKDNKGELSDSIMELIQNDVMVSKDNYLDIDLTVKEFINSTFEMLALQLIINELAITPVDETTETMKEDKE